MSSEPPAEAEPGISDAQLRLRRRRRRHAIALATVVVGLIVWPSLLDLAPPHGRLESLRVLGPVQPGGAGGKPGGAGHAGGRGPVRAARTPPRTSLPPPGPGGTPSVVEAQLPEIPQAPPGLVNPAILDAIAALPDAVPGGPEIPGLNFPGAPPPNLPSDVVPFGPPPGTPGGPGGPPVIPPPGNPPITPPAGPPPVTPPDNPPPVITPVTPPGTSCQQDGDCPPGPPPGPPVTPPGTTCQQDADCPPGGGPGGGPPPTGVPEPAAWLEMILGAALAGASMRRRRVALRAGNVRGTAAAILRS